MTNADMPEIIKESGNFIVKLLKQPSFLQAVCIFGLFALLVYVTPMVFMTWQWAAQTDRIVDAVKDSCGGRFAHRSHVVTPTE